MISAPWPEINHLLLDALSQANTLGGRDGAICLNHTKTSFTSSDLTVILPSASTSCAPCPANTALIQLIASVQVLNGMPKGYPALAHFSAATKNASHVQASASASSGDSPAGYIRVTSSPTNCLKWSMRAHGFCPSFGHRSEPRSTGRCASRYIPNRAAPCRARRLASSLAHPRTGDCRPARRHTSPTFARRHDRILPVLRQWRLARACHLGS